MVTAGGFRCKSAEFSLNTEPREDRFQSADGFYLLFSGNVTDQHKQRNGLMKKNKA